MSYTLDLIIVSIGIIGFFLIGINIDILLVYSYICFICAYYISIFSSTNVDHAKLEF